MTDEVDRRTDGEEPDERGERPEPEPVGKPTSDLPDWESGDRHAPDVPEPPPAGSSEADPDAPAGHSPHGAVATDAPPAAGEGESEMAHEEAHEPRYFLIWGVLLVLTLAEVGYAFLSLPKFWLALGLIVMAVWKAMLVALYYMHLRWEPRSLWLLVASPLPLAAILILAVITEF